MANKYLDRSKKKEKEGNNKGEKDGDEGEEEEEEGEKGESTEEEEMGRRKRGREEEGRELDEVNGEERENEKGREGGKGEEREREREEEEEEIIYEEVEGKVRSESDMNLSGRKSDVQSMENLPKILRTTVPTPANRSETLSILRSQGVTKRVSIVNWIDRNPSLEKEKAIENVISDTEEMEMKMSEEKGRKKEEEREEGSFEGKRGGEGVREKADEMNNRKRKRDMREREREDEIEEWTDDEEKRERERERERVKEKGREWEREKEKRRREELQIEREKEEEVLNRREKRKREMESERERESKKRKKNSDESTFQTNPPLLLPPSSPLSSPLPHSSPSPSPSPSPSMTTLSNSSSSLRIVATYFWQRDTNTDAGNVTPDSDKPKEGVTFTKRMGVDGEAEVNEEIQRVFAKESFQRMRVIGQFNLGFLICKVLSLSLFLHLHYRQTHFSLHACIPSAWIGFVSHRPTCSG